MSRSPDIRRIHDGSSLSINDSYRACHALTCRARSSFPFAFWLLPAPMRRAMWALYAFYRHTDDLVDNEQPIDNRRQALIAWREDLEEALAGDPRGPLLPALRDTAQRFAIPRACLTEAIDGAAMDLDQSSYETFDELRVYCHRVASVVGVACIYVWGFEGDEALDAAEDCGVAFQLTNILRDLKEDARRGRVYIPREELCRFGCDRESFLTDVLDEPIARLVRFEMERAERHYDDGVRLQRHLSPPGRRIFRLMLAAYRGLLEEIKRRRGDVFSHPVRLTTFRKARLFVGAMGAGIIANPSCPASSVH